MDSTAMPIMPPRPPDPARTRFMIADPQQGLSVASIEHPARHQAGSQVVWNAQDTSNPVQVYAWAGMPDGSEMFELLPHEGCYWLEPNLGMRPIGSRHLGFTLLPPMAPDQAIVQFLIPKYRGNRPGLQLRNVAPVPDLPQRLRASELAQARATGISATISYPELGRTMVEEFWSCHFLLPPVPGQFVQHNWGLTRSFAFRAEESRLPALREEFLATAWSVFYNQAWLDVVTQTVNQLNGQFMAVAGAQLDKLRSEAQFQQQLSAYYQQQRDNQSAAVAASVAHQAEVNAARHGPVGGAGGQSAQDALGDQLLGRVAYQDPNSATGNYAYDYNQSKYMWTDGQGGFVGSDDPNFDPNVGSDRNWTQADPA